MRSSIFALSIAGVSGCSNLLIPGGSTQDGSTIISYSADAETVFGAIDHWPAATHSKGDLREIYDWDTGVRLGAIPEPEETYNVVGNTNEHQLAITETTYGGLEVLSGGGGDGNGDNTRAVCNKQYGCIDYGQLIWVTLQRAKTAQEAITTIDSLMQTYGYASSGESFSIADPKEVWLMELIGKGNYSMGAVWVATKIPDGYVCAHANQARTRRFPKDQPEKVRYSPDVVSFARDHNLYSGSDQDFSFSDVYDPVTFSGARFCEARVFSFFDSVAAPEENMAQYLDYVQGYNLTNRMPLYVKTRQRLTVNDTMWHMRNHYEGTWFDPRKDIGAGKWYLPNRLGEGLQWQYKGKSYVNERPIGTQYAGWNMIANQRPNQKYSVNWFGTDDSTFSPHTPFYGATTKVPPSWSGANCTARSACREAFGLPGTITKFSIKSMHWIVQMVANYAYSRYDVIGDAVKERLVSHEAAMFKAVEQADKKIDEAGGKGVDVATAFSFEAAEKLHDTWTEFYGDLFMTYVDGYKTVEDKSNAMCGCAKELPQTSDEWKARVVMEAGDKYAVPTQLKWTIPGVIDKLSLRALGGAVRRKGCSKDQAEGSGTEEASRVVV